MSQSEFEKALHNKMVQDISSVIKNPEAAIIELAYWSYKQGLKKAEEIAENLDTIVILDCPCGISTSVPASRTHISQAIKAEREKL